MEHPINWLGAFGIGMDILGAAWIAKALAFSSDDALLDQAATRWDLSSAVLEALEQSRLDTRCGLALLLIGFVMQFCGVFIAQSPTWVAGLPAALGLTFVVAYYIVVRRREERTRLTRIQQYVLRGGNVP